MKFVFNWFGGKNLTGKYDYGLRALVELVVSVCVVHTKTVCFC